jgi:DNA-binding GntR family transcriptional regulator
MTMKASSSPLKVSHRTIASAAAEEIRRRIINGEFPGGHQLRQDQLSAELGISRIPLREALVQLESEGLVRILPHRGAVVSELSAEEITELFDLRRLLEPRLLERSAPLLNPSDYMELERNLNEYSDEFKNMNVSRWGQLNTQFHLLLYSKSGLTRTFGIVSLLLQSTDRYTRLQLSLTQASRLRAEKEHKALVDLCRNGEVGRACQLLDEHILGVENELVSFFAKQGGIAPTAVMAP